MSDLVPGNLFWLGFVLGALALALFGRNLPFPPLAHMIWGVMGTTLYLVRVKVSGRQVSINVGMFVAGSLIVLSLFVFLVSSKISSL
ncbi:hypothetical protein [Erythrobacter crassostreae]|uniref:Uncharacterized protein n=1 Tax=Erythrobacter crassostreae TaxID=2828328 RepID=A0A9X1JKA8_9SPHN|nr:hypothetical protein [Erythrobacter crassostrea]MBV7258761.1 hypothetical protein [Erythrobacter crassostrea]